MLGRSAGRSLGRGAVEAIAARDTVVVDLERRLADSAAVFLDRAFRRAVLEPARAQWDSMAAGVGDAGDSAAVRVARRVRTDLNRSVQQLLHENLDVLDARGPRLARSTVLALTAELNRALPGALAAAGDTLGQRLVAGLALGIRDVLDPTLHRVMQEVTDSLRSRLRQVDTTVASSRTVGGLRYGLIGGSLVLIVAAGVVAFGHWRRQGRALDALVEAVNARSDPTLHETIQSCAHRAGVHDWLSDRLAAGRTEADSGG